MNHSKPINTQPKLPISNSSRDIGFMTNSSFGQQTNNFTPSKRSSSLVSFRRLQNSTNLTKNLSFENFNLISNPKPGVMGIKNHGSTCYSNSVIQCLNNCVLFAEHLLLIYTDRNSSDKDLKLIYSLSRLLFSIWKGHVSSKVSLNFYIMYSSMMTQLNSAQNDAHEYLQLLLNQLKDEDNIPDHKIEQLFFCKYATMIKCKNCQHVKVINVNEMTLCLSIPELSELELVIVTSENCHYNYKPIFETNLSYFKIKDIIVEKYKLTSSNVLFFKYKNGIIQYVDDQSWSICRLKAPIVYVLEMDYKNSNTVKYINIILVVSRKENKQKYSFKTITHFSIAKDSSYNQLTKEIVKRNIILQLEDSLEVFNFNSKICLYLEKDKDNYPLYTEIVENSLFVLNEKEHLVLLLNTTHNLKISNQCMNPTNNNNISKHDSRELDLNMCIDSYIHEDIDTTMNWTCNNCWKQQGASIQLSISYLPDILVFHLKRFKQHNNEIVKCDTMVTFPLENLDMRKYVDKVSDAKSCIYDLVSVCNHYGTLENGHYKAYCKNPLNNKWHIFDDEKVTKINENDIISRDAYLLFYQRRCSSNQISCQNIKSILDKAKPFDKQFIIKPPQSAINLTMPLNEFNRSRRNSFRLSNANKIHHSRNKSFSDDYRKIDTKINLKPQQVAYNDAFKSLDCSIDSNAALNSTKQSQNVPINVNGKKQRATLFNSTETLIPKRQINQVYLNQSVQDQLHFSSSYSNNDNKHFALSNNFSFHDDSLQSQTGSSDNQYSDIFDALACSSPKQSPVLKELKTKRILKSNITSSLQSNYLNTSLIKNDFDESLGNIGLNFNNSCSNILKENAEVKNSIRKDPIRYTHNISLNRNCMKFEKVLSHNTSANQYLHIKKESTV